MELFLNQGLALLFAVIYSFLKNLQLLILEEEEERETVREEERERFVVPLIYAFIGWYLYVPCPEIKPTTLADALTNRATGPDLQLHTFILSLPILGFLPPLCTSFMAFSVGELCPPSPPSAADENKSTKTWSAWGGEVANLSKEKGPEPFPQWAFTGFNLHQNTDKAHQSLSGSKDQTIDNKQRTLRAYSESGSVS